MVFLDVINKFVFLPLIMSSEDLNLVCVNLNEVAVDGFRPALSNRLYSGVSEKVKKNVI